MNRKEREKEKRPVGMAKDFDFRILVIYVVFKITIQVESTTKQRPEQFRISCTATKLT